MRRVLALSVILGGAVSVLHAQGRAPVVFTHADTLRGSNTPERAWWDVAFYDLQVAVNPADSTVRGRNGITYRVLAAPREMQIDLRTGLDADSIIQDAK